MPKLSSVPLIKRFLADRAGNFAMTAALCFAAIGGTAGLAIDYSRIYSTQSSMAAALDSAIIATAVELNQSDMTTDEAKDYLTDFLEANLEQDGFNYDVAVESIDIDWNVEEITAHVSTNLPMTLMRVAGWDEMPLTTGASSLFGASITEVSMAFDITGSMRGDKIEDLKDAARAGIEKLLATNTQSRERMRISLVPYSSTINAGRIARNAYRRSGNLAGWRANPDNCLSERTGTHMGTDAGPQHGVINRDNRIGSCPEVEILPLTNDKLALDRLIDDLEASGYTAGHLGIEWAWYTLSPEWRSVFRRKERPDEYAQDLFKFAIIMTDGEFNTAYANVPGWESVNQQQDRSRSYALNLCTNMKAKGIRIFTIGFDLRNGDALDMLRQCATPDTASNQYFYSAATGEELARVYDRIAGQIQMVRLVR